MNHPALAVPRPSGLRRGVASLATVLLATGAGAGSAAPAAAAGPPVPTSQALVVLSQARVARAAPSAKARRIETVAVVRPLTHVRTVLPVLSRTTGADGQEWVRVLLPGRPNGHSGWIPATGSRPSGTGWQLVVDLSARQVKAYDEGHLERTFRAVVGKPSTPTPVGRFFVEEAVALSAADAGGPYALATSARSPVLQEFEGGPGQIALHGTNHLAGALGTAASHGCVRLSTPAITWLVARIGRGFPVTVTR